MTQFFSDVKTWLVATTTVPNWSLVATGVVTFVLLVSHC